MAGEKDKRPAKFDDSYYQNGIKTLEDFFNYESKLLAEKEALRTKLFKASTEAEKKEYKKLIDDVNQKYTKLYVNIEKAAAKSIKDQEVRRINAQLKEYKEYEALLKKQVAAGLTSEKKKNKQLKNLQTAQSRENKAREIKEANEGKKRAKQAREDLLEASKEQWGGAGGWKNSGEQMMASLSHSLEHGLKQIGKTFADISNKINSAIDTFSKYQSSIDARLQDSDKSFLSAQSALMRAVGASPYLKTETMLNNLQSLVEAGIVTNLEQRAFLQTIKDKIATTFDVANSSLLRIIRLQRNDSTASRLGMEAYLTSMMNMWVQNTEYLNQTFDSVQEALLEASSIMNTAESTEFEYIVQKWLGALTGRGLSESTATGLAGALGMLGSGNVTGLSSNALNNLLVMAAANAGLDYGDLLINGLNKSNVNKLLLEVVKYMQSIDKNNNVVRAQYAQTFGLSVSDLAAASNLEDLLSTVYANEITYQGMFSELGDQLNKVSSRTHISEKINNLFDNAQFSLASTIAGSPVMSALWKVTDMIQGVTGGINIPMISVLGTAIDLETTIENLMKLGLVGFGSLGMIEDVVSGLSMAGGRFSNVMSALGMSSKVTNYRSSYSGRGLAPKLAPRSRGLTTSETSSLVANSSGEDIGDQTLNSAMDESKQKQAAAAAETDNPQADMRDYFLNVFDKRFVGLIEMIATGQGFTKKLVELSPLDILMGISNKNIETIHDIDFELSEYEGGSTGSPIYGVQNYLVNVFDAKFNNLMAMVAHSNGYAEAGMAQAINLTGNTVRATYQVSDDMTSNKEVLDNISSNVSNIYDLLANGVIKVRMEEAIRTTSDVGGLFTSGF